MPKYIWPPHPHSSMKIMAQQLPHMEELGTHYAQLKYQGDRSPVRILNGEVQQFSRHGGKFKMYSMPVALMRLFQALKIPPDKEVWLDGELLHARAVSKQTGQQEQKNTVVLFDVLYYGGYLLATEQQPRLDMLAAICDHPTKLEERGYGLVVAEEGGCAIWMAETWDKDFLHHYERFAGKDERQNDLHPLIEGLMLRRKKFRLPTGLEEYDTRDMVRCRRPTHVRAL